MMSITEANIMAHLPTITLPETYLCDRCEADEHVNGAVCVWEAILENNPAVHRPYEQFPILAHHGILNVQFPDSYSASLMIEFVSDEAAVMFACAML
jgi:hypothetical protein